MTTGDVVDWNAEFRAKLAEYISQGMNPEVAIRAAGQYTDQHQARAGRRSVFRDMDSELLVEDDDGPGGVLIPKTYTADNDKYGWPIVQFVQPEDDEQ